MTVTLEIDGTPYKLPNQFMIPIGVKKKYLRAQEYGFLVNGSWQPVNLTDYCPTCNRHITESSSIRNGSPQWVICPDPRVNRVVNYCARICIDCKYWLLVDMGYDVDKVPKTIKAKLVSGFTPSNIDIYLS